MSSEFFVRHESGIQALVTADSIEAVREALPGCYSSEDTPKEMDELARLTLIRTHLNDPVLKRLCQEKTDQAQNFEPSY